MHKGPLAGPLSFRFSDLAITYNLAGFRKKIKLQSTVNCTLTQCNDTTTEKITNNMGHDMNDPNIKSAYE